MLLLIMGNLLFAMLLLTVPTAWSVTVKPEFDDSGVLHVDKIPFFRPGQKLTLRCGDGAPGVPFNWTKHTLGKPPSFLGQAGIAGSTVMLEPITEDTGGNYTCNDGVSTEAFYFVNVLHENSLFPVHVTSNGTEQVVRLRCLQRFSRVFPLIWRHVDANRTLVVLDKPHTSHDDRKYSVDSELAEGSYALVIRSPRGRYPEKTGDYVCELDTAGTDIPNTIKQTVRYRSKPDVRFQDGKIRNPKSINAMKADSVSLTCVYSGQQFHRVKWTVDNGTEVNKSIVEYDEPLTPCHLDNTPDNQRMCPSRNPRYALSRDFKAENDSASEHEYEYTSVLEIPVVEDYDRALYCCFVRNEYGENEACVKIRVKSKLAALWPFLGICAEVLILAIIICACERKRSKEIEELEETKPIHETNERDRGATREVGAVRNRK